MTESRQDPGTDNPFHDAEPARDPALAAQLRALVGVPPVGDVDWGALSARIALATAQGVTPWWSYAARWERRAVPLALAAGLAGALALWNLGAPAPARAIPSADFVTAVVSGATADDAARTFAGSLTSTDDFTVDVPE